MSSRMNMIPRSEWADDCVHQEMFAIKPDHTCESMRAAGFLPPGKCAIGEAGQFVGSKNRCWKCDLATARTPVGLCIGCRDEMRSW